MRLPIAAIAATVLLTGGAAQAASIEIKDALVRVTVIPEDRADVRVDVVRPNAELPLTVRAFGDRTVIDGGLARRLRGCNGLGEKRSIRVRGVGAVRWDEIPQVVIHAPRAVALSASGVVSGVIGRAASLDLRNSGCSQWTIADVTGDAALRESGAGSVRMGASSRLDLHLSGASRVHAARVRQRLDARLSGAGGVQIDEASGVIDARVSGVGQVKVAGGRVSKLSASVSGVGGVEFDGVAESLDASISGLGGVRVREVTGPITKSVTGGGSVRVGNRPS